MIVKQNEKQQITYNPQLTTYNLQLTTKTTDSVGNFVSSPYQSYR